MKTITIQDTTWRKLWELKLDLLKDNMDDIISDLIKFYKEKKK